VKIVSKIKLEAPEKKNRMGSERRNVGEPGWDGLGKPTLIEDFP
jgi:hypothetical protein